MVHGSRFRVHDSWFKVHDSWLRVRSRGEHGKNRVFDKEKEGLLILG